MAEKLELQQVICPSCKQVISSFSPFQAEVECPYCHNKAFNPLITAKKIPIPERIIPFKKTVENFEERMIRFLVDTDFVPGDIFQCINTDKVIKAYLPMFLFEGKYQSSWTCKILDKDGKKGKVSFVRHSGTCQGNFSVMCLAYEGNDIPTELERFGAKFPYSALDSKEYDPVLLELESCDNLITVEMNSDPELVWARNGASLIKRFAREQANKQLSGEVIESFNSSDSYDLNGKGRYILAPFWFVYYTYRKEKHFFIMDGLGINVSYSTPKDKLAMADCEKLENQSTYFDMAAMAVCIVLCFVFGWPGLVPIIILTILSIVGVNKLNESKKQVIVDGLRRKRRNAAAQIRKQ